MQSTQSTLFTNLFIVTKSKNNTAYSNLLAEISSNNIQTTFILLHLSYAYSFQVSQYTLISRIINGRISLNDLLIGLAQFISLDSYSISYSSDNYSLYFHCGTYPLQDTVLCELTQSKEIWVKLRQNTNENKSVSLMDIYDVSNETESIDLNDEKNNEQYSINNNSKRAKERNIGDIVRKLYLWRKLYNGVYDKNNSKVKMTWNQTAKLIGINLKSLDDYYHQIKYGKYFKFDFTKHKHEKVGVLRGFIKAHLKKLDPLALQELKSGKLLKEIKEMKENSKTNETESESESYIYSEINNDNEIKEEAKKFIMNQNYFFTLSDSLLLE